MIPSSLCVHLERPYQFVTAATRIPIPACFPGALLITSQRNFFVYQILPISWVSGIEPLKLRAVFFGVHQAPVWSESRSEPSTSVKYLDPLLLGPVCSLAHAGRRLSRGIGGQPKTKWSRDKEPKLHLLPLGVELGRRGLRLGWRCRDEWVVQ